MSRVLQRALHVSLFIIVAVASFATGFLTKFLTAFLFQLKDGAGMLSAEILISFLKGIVSCHLSAAVTNLDIDEVFSKMAINDFFSKSEIFRNTDTNDC